MPRLPRKEILLSSMPIFPPRREAETSLVPAEGIPDALRTKIFKALQEVYAEGQRNPRPPGDVMHWCWLEFTMHDIVNAVLQEFGGEK